MYIGLLLSRLQIIDNTEASTRANFLNAISNTKMILWFAKPRTGGIELGYLALILDFN